MKGKVCLSFLSPGYGHWKGQVLNSNELRALYEGLKLNAINSYTHLLTGIKRFKGYIGVFIDNMESWDM